MPLSDIIPPQNAHAIRAELNYIRPDTTLAPKVIYSGGAAPQSYNDAYDFMVADIHDARGAKIDFTLDVEGFQLATAPTRLRDFNDEKKITSLYYDEVAGIIRRATDAKDVFVFDHTVRRGQAESVRKPAHHVHNDYTARTGPIRAEEAIGAERFAALKGRRMVQINVWRPLSPVVRRSPLAFCDAASIRPEDLVPAEIHFTDDDYLGEIYALRKNNNQRWWYFNEMTRDEVVMIKGYDTDTDVARFTPHTAFEYPDQDPDIPPRESIETRSFAFY